MLYFHVLGINFNASTNEFNIQENALPKLENYDNFIEGNGDNHLHESHSMDKNLETIFQNPRIALDDDSISQIPATRESTPRHFFIMIIPILMNLLLALYNIFQIEKDFLYLNKIFLPLIGYEIYEYIFSPNVHFSSSLISSVILLSNRPYSRQLNFFVRYFLRTVQDVMIYFFVFLVCQLCTNIMFFKL